MSLPEIPEALIHAVTCAKRIAILTGAGVSAESGIPTFRDALTGLWEQYDPAELATPEAFARQPDVVTEWYDHRRQMVLNCEPNDGHRAIVALTDLIEENGGAVTLITQNVDRLHQRAGSRIVYELHGCLLNWRCSNCGEQAVENGPAFETYPPICVACGGHRRPGVVWFGEMLPSDALAGAVAAAEQCDLFMSIGTSGLVEPAASLARLASAANAQVVEINPEPTPLTREATWSIAASAGVALSALVEAVRSDGWASPGEVDKLTG